MKYLQTKTTAILFSAIVLLGLAGCDGTEGIASDSQLVGSIGQMPVAQAGADRTIIEGDPLTLDGRNSYDPDGEIVSYVWNNEGNVKEGVTVVYDNMVYRAEPYVIELTVTDDDGNRASDSVEITVVKRTGTNLPPVAAASISPKVFYDCSTNADYYTNMTLDASASTDPEGEVLKYAWSGTIEVGTDHVSIENLIDDKNSMTTSIEVAPLCDQCANSGGDEEIQCDVTFNVKVTDTGDLSDNAQVSATVDWPYGAPI